MVTVSENLIREILDRLTRLEGRSDAVEARMATKEDLARVETRLDSVENRMATKEDLAQMETRLVKWVVGAIVTSVAVATGLATLIDRLT